MDRERTKRIFDRVMGDPKLRRIHMAQVIVATQAREGIDTTLEQAFAAYDKVQAEKRDCNYNIKHRGVQRKGV